MTQSSQSLLLDIEEILIEDSDLRILKSLSSDVSLGKEFFAEYDPTLFSGDAKVFGQLLKDWYRKYSYSPSSRILMDFLGTNHPFAAKCSWILSSIENIDSTTEEYLYDLDKLKQKHKKIRISSLKETLNNSEDYDEVVKYLKQEIELANALTGKRKKSFTQKTFKQYIDVFKSDYFERKNNPNAKAGLATGYSYLDYVTGGLQKSNLWIIAGETSSGKSTFLNNLGLNIWKQNNNIFLPKKEYAKNEGCNVVYFSLEMPFKLCFRRSVAALANVALYGLRDSSLSQIQWESVERILEFMSVYPFEFQIVDIPRGATINDIEYCYSQSCNSFEPDAIMADYMGLMERDVSGEDDWLKLAKIAGELHEFGRVHDKGVGTAVQLNTLNKPSKDSSEIIGVHRIGRSKSIMDHADVGIQIEKRSEEHTWPDLRGHLIKNREGELGSFSLIKNFKNATIKDQDPPFNPNDLLGGVSDLTQASKDLSEAFKAI